MSWKDVFSVMFVSASANSTVYRILSQFKLLAAKLQYSSEPEAFNIGIVAIETRWDSTLELSG